MNPLDFSGPSFLVFYALCGAAVCGGLRWLNWAREPHMPTRVAPTDPQTIAYLRGGATETLRITAVTLLEQGVLLLGPNDTLRVAAKHKLSPGASIVDRVVCNHFAAGDEALSLLKNDGLLASARAHAERELESAGLIPDETLRDARKLRFLAAAGALGMLAGLKITVALQRGHSNVGLLLIEAAVFGFIAYGVTTRGRTPAGDRAQKYLMHTFESVRQRAQSTAHPVPGDVALVAAVFGLAALPGVPYANVGFLQPRQGGSGGGCGGGCGGCGGCGG